MRAHTPELKGLPPQSTFQNTDSVAVRPIKGRDPVGIISQLFDPLRAVRAPNSRERLSRVRHPGLWLRLRPLPGVWS